MSQYYLSKHVDHSYEDTLRIVTEKLAEEGFGIITEIDVRKVVREKLDKEFKKYKILGACNPVYSHQAIGMEDKLGVLLPCNVVVEEHENGQVEVSAMDPAVVLRLVDQPGVQQMAAEIREKIQKVLNNI